MAYMIQENSKMMNLAGKSGFRKLVVERDGKSHIVDKPSCLTLSRFLFTFRICAVEFPQFNQDLSQ